MIRKFIPLFMLVLIYCSCQKNSYYQNVKPISQSGWKVDQKVYFRDTLMPSDPEHFHLEIELRHNTLYPYQNIWLYIETKCSDGTARTDSINWTLAEPNGKWLGTGWGSLYNSSYRLPDIKVRKTAGKRRWFSIDIQHGMKDKILNGIENVGIKIY